MKKISLALALWAWLSLFSSARAFHGPTSALLRRPGRLQNTFQDFFDKDLIQRMETELSIVEPNQVQEETLRAFFVPDDQQQPHPIIVCAQTGSGKTMTSILLIIQALRNSPTARGLVVAPNDLLVDQHQTLAELLDATVLDRIQFVSLTSGIPIDDHDEATMVIAIDEIDAVLYGGSQMDAETELTTVGQALLKHIMSPQKRTILLGTTAYLSSAHHSALFNRDLPVGAKLLREEGISSAQTQVLVPTLRQKFKYFSGNRMDKLVDVVKETKNDEWLSSGSTMIFCGDVEQAREVFVELSENIMSDENEEDMTRLILIHEELDKEAIHALMTQLRHDNKSSEGVSTSILVCTDVAARGLDIPNIRHVILHTVPTTVSAFIHQVGRTARKGQDGLLTCLVNTASGDAQKYTHLHTLKAASELSFLS